MQVSKDESLSNSTTDLPDSYFVSSCSKEHCRVKLFLNIGVILISIANFVAIILRT